MTNNPKDIECRSAASSSLGHTDTNHLRGCFERDRHLRKFQKFLQLKVLQRSNIKLNWRIFEEPLLCYYRIGRNWFSSRNNIPNPGWSTTRTMDLSQNMKLKRKGEVIEFNRASRQPVKHSRQRVILQNDLWRKLNINSRDVGWVEVSAVYSRLNRVLIKTYNYSVIIDIFTCDLMAGVSITGKLACVYFPLMDY